jgi:hypothetical protein
MTVLANQSANQIVGYFAYELTAGQENVLQTYRVFNDIKNDVLSVGGTSAQATNSLFTWYPFFYIPNISANTSKLKSAQNKFILGNYDVGYRGMISDSQTLNYVSQKGKNYSCWGNILFDPYPSRFEPSGVADPVDIYLQFTSVVQVPQLGSDLYVNISGGLTDGAVVGYYYRTSYFSYTDDASLRADI